MGFDFVIHAVLTILVRVSAPKEHEAGLLQESFKNKNSIRFALVTVNSSSVHPKSNCCHYSDTKDNLTICSVLSWDALRFSLGNRMLSLLLWFHILVALYVLKKNNTGDKTVTEEWEFSRASFRIPSRQNITYKIFNPLISCVSNHSPPLLLGHNFEQWYLEQCAAMAAHWKVLTYSAG